MNFKYIFLSALFCAPILGMEQPYAGTVLSPLHQNGQFTVTAVPFNNKSISDSLPSAAQLASHGCHIAQSKGTPVIISFVAGHAPWWALTLGTGYLLISQCDLSNPALMAPCIAGAGYAAGSHATGYINKIFTNSYLCNATSAALATGCIGLSCATNTYLVQNAFFAAAQAMGIETLIQLSQKLLAAKDTLHTQTTGNVSTPLFNDINKGIFNATSQAIHDNLTGILAELLRNYDATVLVQILLYEQAYRLASHGYHAAYDLCMHLRGEYKFLDARKLTCAII